MIKYVLVFNSQGKIRLTKFYVALSPSDRKRIIDHVYLTVSQRMRKHANIVPYGEDTLVYLRFANVFFTMCIESDENELLALELIKHYVLLLDRAYNKVSENDIIYDFETAYTILDELILAGEVQEPSPRRLIKLYHSQIIDKKDEALIRALAEAGM